MVDTHGFSEDFLQLRTEFESKKYVCTPKYKKKIICLKIMTNEITIDQAVKLLGTKRRNIKNWLNSEKLQPLNN